MIDLATRYKAVVHYKHFKVSAIYNVSIIATMDM